MYQSCPVVDDQNPLYCPTLPATSYLESLRRQVARDSYAQRALGEDPLLSFARLLQNALQDSHSGKPQDSHPRTRAAVARQSAAISAISPRPIDERFNFSDLTLGSSFSQLDSTICDGTRNLRIDAVPVSRPALKRRLSDFSDLNGSEQRDRSLLSNQDTSFDVVVKHECLDYDAYDPDTAPPPYSPARAPKKRRISEELAAHDELKSHVRYLEDELYGPCVGTESPRGVSSLVDRLTCLLPGIRLKERLYALSDLCHQTIADFLADNGLLNPAILSILRTSELRSLSLTASLLDEDGLNLAGQDIFPVFSKPNSFLFLTELIFAGTPLHDFDFTHIHHLPRLAMLSLDNTGIGNEAIYLLVPLKRSLTCLSVAANPDITDDAVPPLILLSKLTYLSICDTNIEMPGLRRFAQVIMDEDRMMEISMPHHCADYVDSMHLKYFLYPTPPLIVNPALCPQLSAAALKRNLAAHAAVNPKIIAAGTKAEMQERLTGILKTRELDVLVKQLLTDGSDDGSDEVF
ncbi:hypothetical protein BD626DRAFT_118050 [Schizophyllum amplum]|uniref:Uncharacterized protein n=1 Tax=Schizophyllum amplum TaxID=97359 RepID=A0A550CUT2_9AGAR|nr:hypothetical protein BD626DRAFT_118050 [Auriculariopsis ampla]